MRRVTYRQDSCGGAETQRQDDKKKSTKCSQTVSFCTAAAHN